MTASTAALASLVPNFPFVCPSNCKISSGIRTEMIAEIPSRISEPSKFLSFSFSKPVFRAYSLKIRVKADFAPVSCVPPSRVRTLFTNDKMFLNNHH